MPIRRHKNSRVLMTKRFEGPSWQPLHPCWLPSFHIISEPDSKHSDNIFEVPMFACLRPTSRHVPNVNRSKRGVEQTTLPRHYSKTFSIGSSLERIKCSGATNTNVNDG